MRVDTRGRRLSVSKQAAADIQLLARMARGDRAALATIYDRHAGAAYAVAERMCDKSRAEDIVEEAFLLLWREVDAGRRDGPIRARLLTLTRQCALERAYGAKHPAHSGPAAAAAPPTIDPAVLELYGRSALPALRAVAPLERQCIELAYFDGFSIEEIADRCQLPRLTVADHLRSGLRHMLRTMTSHLPAAEAG